MTEVADTYRVYLDGEIDDDKAREIIEELNVAHTEYPGCDIDFVINSQGGTVPDGVAIFSELRSMSERCGGEHFVTTKIRGMAGSIATLIFQAGDERVGGLMDYQIWHEQVVSAQCQFISHVKRSIADMEAHEELFLDVVMERAKVSRKTIAALDGPRDRQIFMSEAIELGLADRIA